MLPLMPVAHRLALSLLLTITIPLGFLLPPAIPKANAAETLSVKPAPLTPGTLEAYFDEVMPRYLDQYHVAGATVAVVQDGAVVLTRGYGAAQVGSDGTAGGEGAAPVLPSTPFRIGSLTKLFTWTAVMQLVESGKLDLHADVNRYLDFTLSATYAQPITLWHLMTHTSGFENRNFGYGAATPADLQPLSVWLPAHIPARVRPPGEVAAYSNYGTALAGYIVERVSGEPYVEYVQRYIFGPLGMQGATAELLLPPERAAAVAHGYTYAAATGHFEGAEPPLFQVGPAGSIVAGADDMAQFLLAHLAQDETDPSVLAPSTLATMHAAAFRADPEWPQMAGMALGFFELNRHGEQIIGHVGAALPSFHSLLALLPGRNVGFFVSYNSSGAMPLTTGASAIFLRDFADHFLPEEIGGEAGDANGGGSGVVAPSADFDARAGSLTGSYRYANNPSSSVTTLEKSAELFGGAVTLMAPGDGMLHLRDAWGEKRFVEITPARFRQVSDDGLWGDDALVFRLDEGGRAQSFALSSRSSQSFERLPWYAAPGLSQVLLGVCVLLFLSAIGAWLWRVVRRRKGAEGTPRRAPMAWGLVAAAAALNLLFLLGFAGIMLLAPQSIALGSAALLGAVLFLPLLALLLALGSLPGVWSAWREKAWSLPARLHLTASVLGLALFALVLQQWNLLGWRF